MTTRIADPRPLVVSPSPTTPAPVPSAKDLKRAETLLKKAGFNPGAVDGKSSPALTQALKEFQGAWGLPATGQLDAKTAAKLKATGERISKHKTSPQFVSVGQKSDSIKTIEARLRKLGYDVGKADGIYSRQTAEAVKAFKADQGMRVEGAIAKAGRDLLRSEVEKLNHAPERRRLAPTKAQSRADVKTAAAAKTGVAEGAKNKAVVQNIQKHLRAAGFDPKHTGGVFDERTAAMVKQFQAKSKLPVTGTVDGKTWKALQKSFILSNKPASPAQRENERSGAVKRSEALLQKLGFHVGKVDGLFSKQTTRAVKAFEKKHHLKQDGAIDSKELALLQKSAKGDYRSKALDIARKWLGFHEKGNNGNPFSKHFGRGPEAWCADFVSYCYSKAGKKLNQSYTPTLLAMLKQNGTYTRSKPKAGDIVMFDWHPGSGPTAQHTGLVEKVFKKGGKLYIQTIEGNSSDQVMRHTYPVSSSVIAGFGTIP